MSAASGDSNFSTANSWSVPELIDELLRSDESFSEGGGNGVEGREDGRGFPIAGVSGLLGHTSGMANLNSLSERSSRYSFQKNGFVTISFPTFESKRSSNTPAYSVCKRGYVSR